jgi:hypothetical protein
MRAKLAFDPEADRALCSDRRRQDALMAVLRDDIAAFDRMRRELEANHCNAWVLFHAGQFIGAYSDFEAAATEAVDRFDAGPYLIRQVGAPPIQLPGGMVFTPAHVLGPGGV